MSTMKTELAAIARGLPPGAGNVFWPIPIDAPAARPRLEMLADSAARLSSRRRQTLGELIAASLPLPDAHCAPLNAIWVSETFQRIDGQTQLLSALDARSRDRPADTPPVHLEREVTARLATALRLLGVSASRTLLPCSDLLRAIVRETAELFGPAIGDVVIRTEIERVGLPAVHRRALVLAAYHLVSDALCGGRCGKIAVTLRRHGASRLTLSVRDDGHARMADRASVLDDLAAILDGAVSCRRGSDGTQVDLLFSVRTGEEQS